MAEIISESLFFEDENVAEQTEDNLFTSEKYTANVNIPQYTPSDYCPSISEMMNTHKYEELVKEINDSNVSDEEKRFLRLAATRHIVFDYSKAADYYAHASKEMQILMENSAMVIIDINNALANGYVRLDKILQKLAQEAWLERQEREAEES